MRLDDKCDRQDDPFGVVAEGGGDMRQISPTDIAQFIRLEQCERYLRLRLHERTANPRFMAEYGVVPQAIPSLLTRSGAAFERAVEVAVQERYRALDMAADLASPRKRGDDNGRVLAEIRALSPGATLVLFQPRLHVRVEGWLIRGDVDILRLARDESGLLRALIVDIKSSTAARIEHRLQVAFYHEMLSTLLADEGIACAGIAMGVLYRGPVGEATSPCDGDDAPDAARRERERAQALDLLGADTGLLEIVADPASYRDAVRDLVTGARSTAERVTATPFEEIPYHLTYKCDGCLYNEFCMKRSAEQDDLSLLPHLTAQDKNTLRHNKVRTIRQLAMLKEFRQDEARGAATPGGELVPAPGREALVGAISRAQPTGARLDELVHRARRYRRWKGDTLDSLSYIPNKGYGSLPYCDAGHNPNLVRVYIDAQHDYLHDRLYMLGALVVACEGGVERADRRCGVVRLTSGPPADAADEEALLRAWIDETVRAVVELATHDAEGLPRAPIHLIFYNTFAQRLLLDGLARHASALLAATPLYDFVTQLAAFDSPVATFLDGEIREHKNYPMVCQSLQAVAAYLKFDWNAPVRYRDIFRARLFDFWGKLDHDADDPAPETSP